MKLHTVNAMAGMLLAIATHAQANTFNEATCLFSEQARERLADVFQITSGRDFVDVMVAMQNVERVFDGLRGESRTTNSNRISCPEGGSAALTVTRNSSTELVKEYRLDRCGLLGRSLDGEFISRQQFTVESGYESINLEYADVNGVAISLVDGAYRYKFSDHYLTNDYESNKSLRAKLIVKRSEAGIIWSAADFEAQSLKVGRGSGENQVAVSYIQDGEGASPTRVIEQYHVVDLHGVSGDRLKRLQLTGLEKAISSSSVDKSAIAGCFANTPFIAHNQF